MIDPHDASGETTTTILPIISRRFNRPIVSSAFSNPKTLEIFGLSLPSLRS